MKRKQILKKHKAKGTFPRFYLTMLGISALLIMILNGLSFIQELEGFEQISAKNIEAEGITLVKEIEEQSRLDALECLKNEELAALAAKLDNTVQGNMAFGSKVRDLSGEHPIAKNFFLLVGRRLYFPQLEAGRPYSPIDEIAGSSSPEEKEFADLYRKADRASSLKRYETAIDFLEKCSLMSVSDELKSRALDLLARVYLAAKNPTNAVRIWNRIEDQFPNCINEYHVPYALAAAIEIDQIDAGRNTDRRESLQRLYRDLLEGRWMLSEEVVLELKERLQKRLGYATPEIEDSSFLNQFRLARIVRESLNEKQASVDGEDLHCQIILNGPDNTQLFYLILNKNGSERILAISADTEWIKNDLLVQRRSRLNTSIKALSKFIIQPADAAGNPDLRIPFNNVFSFLELRLPEGAIASSRFTHEVQLATIGLTAFITLSLLVIIMVLILRITKERMEIKIKTDFLSHVSHELKTPVTLIQLYTDTLLTDETLPEEDIRYSLNVISKESTHLLNLIENLLQLSVAENVQEKYEFTEGDMGNFVEKTTGVYAEWLRKQGIELNVQIAPALPLVSFDREKVTRALLNLIDNARKYGGDSNSIELGIWSEKGKVILECRDHGSGIPESERKTIFEQFYRGANASETRGVGLGLFLVSETMKAHNGTVELQTEPGKGSSFKLVFPAI